MLCFNVAEYFVGLVKFALIFVSGINSDFVFGLVLTSFRRNGLVCNVRLTHVRRKQLYIKNPGFSVKRQLYYLTNQLHVSAIVLQPSSGLSQEYKKKNTIQLQ